MLLSVAPNFKMVEAMKADRKRTKSKDIVIWDIGNLLIPRTTLSLLDHIMTRDRAYYA